VATFDTMSNHIQQNIDAEVIFFHLLSFSCAKEINSLAIVSRDFHEVVRNNVSIWSRRSVMIENHEKLANLHRLANMWAVDGFRFGSLSFEVFRPGNIMVHVSRMIGLQGLHFCEESSFNEDLTNLPTTLLSLTLGQAFNFPIGNHLSKLENLVVGESFDQPVDQLPVELKRLVLGKKFNQPVDKLPLGLLDLQVGNKFNQAVDNLPPGLINLRLRLDFNQPVNHLPSTLENLFLHSIRFNHSLDDLPVGLKKLEVKCLFFNVFVGNIHLRLANLKSFVFNGIENLKTD
jgi:hypothetical protein